MLMLLSIRIAEFLTVWERAVHSVHCGCLSWAFVDLCVCFFPILVLRVGRGILLH